MDPIKVPQSQISIDEQDVITVDSPELLNRLIHNNEKTLSSLDEEGIKLTDISISSNGKLQIANKVFAAKLKEQLYQTRSDRNPNWPNCWTCT